MILTFQWTSVNPGARALFIFKMPDYLRIAIDFKFLCETVNRPLPKGFADYKVFSIDVWPRHRFSVRSVWGFIIVSSKKGVRALVEKVHIELPSVLVDYHISSMNSDDVPDFVDSWQVLKLFGVENHCSISTL